MPNDNKCHCGKPAPWFLRVVPTKRLSIAEGTPIGSTVIDDHSIDSWAACYIHLAQAASGLLTRNDMTNAVLILRSED